MMEHLVLAHAAPPSWLALLVGPAVLAWLALRRPGAGPGRRVVPAGRRWTAVAAVGIGFQVFHLAEHVLQATYWAVHPGAPPWLTPWAAAARDGLASLTDGAAGTGNEVLHLVGNLVFLAGLAAAVVASHQGDGAAGAEGRRWLRRGLLVQGLHVAEHVALTLTWLAWGRALGASNLLGLLEPGTPLASGARVWVHFTVNLVATLLVVRGVQRGGLPVPWRSAGRPRTCPPGDGCPPRPELCPDRRGRDPSTVPG